MIRTDLGVGKQNDVKVVEPLDNKVANVVNQQQQSSTNGQLQPFYKSTGTPSRAGELSAGSNMLKAQMLKATSLQTDSIALSNGQLHTVNPSNGNNNAPHTIYINGINGDADGTSREAGILANSTGRPVDHIFQQSTIGNVALREALTLAARAAIFGGFGGLGATVAKARTDLMKKLENPAAANTAANQIIAQLGSPTSTQEVRMVGYSQGATITAQATRMVAAQLTKQYGAQTAEKMMSRVHVITLGGAASRTDFPKGLQLTQVFHQHDPVSQFFGDDKTPIWQDLFKGKDILKPHEYYNDPMVLSVVNRWQSGQIDNTNVQLADPQV